MIIIKTMPSSNLQKKVLKEKKKNYFDEEKSKEFRMKEYIDGKFGFHRSSVFIEKQLEFVYGKDYVFKQWTCRTCKIRKDNNEINFTRHPYFTKKLRKFSLTGGVCKPCRKLKLENDKIKYEEFLIVKFLSNKTDPFSSDDE